MADDHQQRLDEEVEQLRKDIMRIGKQDESGNWIVKFGTLFDDEEVTQYYEALVGTLRTAKKRGVVKFPGQMLLKGAHDNVDITLI